MYSKKNSGPKIEPCGTLFVFINLFNCSDEKVFCI